MKKWFFISLVVLVLIVIGRALRKSKFLDVANDVWDKISADRIATLHPAVRAKVVELVNRAEKAGIRLRVVSAHRSHEEQEKIYEQGRGLPGKIVTNAKPGSSFHNFGLAVDVVPIVNGQADFNTRLWPKIAAIGKALGFRWGGDFKSIVDKPHFEYTFGKSLKQLQNLYAAGVRDPAGYVKIV